MYLLNLAEKQVAKMKAEADATRKKLLAKAALEEKTDLKDLEIAKQEEIAQILEIRFARNQVRLPHQPLP